MHLKELTKFFHSFIPIGTLLKERQYRRLIFFTLFILACGTVFYRLAEGWTWLDSLYFCVISLTTVGYGDLSPQRPISKIFTMFYLVGGISILLGFINAIAAHRMKSMGSTDDKKNE